MNARPIPGCPGYYASDDGAIWSYYVRRGFDTMVVDMTAAPRQLSTFDRGRHDGTPSGYRSVNLTRDGKRCNRYVHDLVLLTFVGPRPVDEFGPIQACHKNDRPGDNRLENLRWGTVQENMSDRRENHAARAQVEPSHAFADLLEG